MDSSKINFFRLLNLVATTPENDSSKILENHSPILSNQYIDLLEKNNSIKTGYENFCIKKGAIQLFPFKDFDFIGKHVVCQKCCQKFASRLSYRAHVGTNICVRTYNGPNLIYLKYKNRNCKQLRKRNKNKRADDINGHHVKKNLLNPEMLNTLQTRNNCYSDVIHLRNKSKEKPGSSSNKSNEPLVKKPRGRPRKIIETETSEPTKKRGRPKKHNTVVVVNNPRQHDSNLNNNTETSNNSIMDRSLNSEDAFNNNYSEERKRELTAKMKFLTHRFWTLASNDWKIERKSVENSNSTEEIKLEVMSVKEQEVVDNIDRLENDLRMLYKQFQNRSELCFDEEIESMLSKLIEKREDFIKGKCLRTDINNGLSTNKGKENIECTVKPIKDENKINYTKNDKNIEVWLSNDNISAILNDNSERSGCSDVEDLPSKINFENNLNTLRKEISSSCSNLVANHMSGVDFNYSRNTLLGCKICGKVFASIAEKKIHRSEHMAMVNKKFLCKICGHKFKVLKNYIKHVTIHRNRERKAVANNESKNFKCKMCDKQYNYLRSYYAHVKTHK